MRKPAFSLFYCLCILTLFSKIVLFIDHYCVGVSNKHCLLPLLYFHVLEIKKLPKKAKTEKSCACLNFLRFNNDHTEGKRITK